MSARGITQAVDDRRLQASESLSSRVAKQQPRLQLLQPVLWGVLSGATPNCSQPAQLVSHAHLGSFKRQGTVALAIETPK